MKPAVNCDSAEKNYSGSWLSLSLPWTLSLLILFKCNWTSSSRPPKMSCLCSDLWESIACESLDHTGSYFYSLEYGNWKDLPHKPIPTQCFHSCEKSILTKNPVLPTGTFSSLVLPKNAIRFQHLGSIICQVIDYRRFQTNKPLMRVGSLREIPNIVIWLGNFWYFGKLVAEEMFSLSRDGCSREVVATGGSTVVFF